jgi:hypothetical protein
LTLLRVRLEASRTGRSSVGEEMGLIVRRVVGSRVVGEGGSGEVIMSGDEDRISSVGCARFVSINRSKRSVSVIAHHLLHKSVTADVEEKRLTNNRRH